MLLPSTGTQRPRACLSGTVLSDDLLEAQEEFTARLVGVVSDGGMLDSDPDRVTFEPRDVRILINDDTSERESLCTRIYVNICYVPSMCIVKQVIFQADGINYFMDSVV